MQVVLVFCLGAFLNWSPACDGAAEAVVHALLAHDHQVESLEFDASMFERVADLAASDRAGKIVWGDWVLGREGRFGQDSQGNWYVDGRYGGRSDRASPMTFQPVRFTSSSVCTVGWNPGSNAYVIRENEAQPRGLPGPFVALGRWIDLSGTKRLGEFLLENASLLAIQDVDKEEGLILLRAEALVQHRPNVLLVTIDTKHGFAPRVIRRFDAVFNHLEEEIITERFAKFQGIWLPMAGTRCVFTRSPLSDDVQRRFDESIRRISKEKGTSESDLDVIRAASTEVFGAAGHPVVPVGGGIMGRFEVTQVHSLNAGLSDEYMTVIVEATARAFNFMTGLSTADGHPLEEVVAGCPLIQVAEGRERGTAGSIPGQRR